MPPPDKTYISNAYAALKDNLEGFNKTPEEFNRLITSDKGYRTKVYTALKDTLEGFDKTPEQFDNAVYTPDTVPQHYEQQGFLIDQLVPKLKEQKVKGDIQSLTGVKPLSETMQDKSIQEEGENRKTARKELRKQAIVNTVKIKNKNLGIEVDENSRTFKNDLNLTKKALQNGEIAVTYDKEGRPATTRLQKFGETLVKSLVESVKAPIEAYKVNQISDPKELADYFDDKRNREPDVKESVPSSGLAGTAAGIIGGLPKLAGLLAIPYAGHGLMVAEAYGTSLAAKTEELYNKGLEENIHRGMDESEARIDAARRAKESAGLEAIPDAVIAHELGRSTATSNLTTPAITSFKSALGKYVKGGAKMFAIGGAGGAAEKGVEAANGYKVTTEDVVKGALEKGTDFAVMHLMLDIANPLTAIGKSAPKSLVAMAKEGIRSAPPEIVDAVTEGSPEVRDGLNSYEAARSKVVNDIPEKAVPHIAGLVEKQDRINKQIEELKNKNMTLHPALQGEIKEEIKHLQVQTKAIDEQIAKMAKSDDPIVHEVDQVTGERQVDLKHQEEIQTKKENDAVSEKKALPLEESTQNAKFDTNKDVVSEGTQEKSNVDRQASGNNQAEISKRRVEAADGWLEAVERNDSEASRNEEEKLVREPIYKVDTEGGAILSDSNRGREKVRTSGDNGEEVGPKTSEIGTRTSQRQEHIEQLGRELGIADSKRSLDTPREGEGQGRNDTYISIPKDVREQVVKTARSLFDMRDNEQRTLRAGSLRQMLREAKTAREKEFITKTIEYYALQKQSANGLLLRQPQGSGKAGSEPRRVAERNSEEPARPRSEEVKSEGQNNQDVQTEEVKPIGDFTSTNGHKIVNEDGQIKVISGKGKNIGKEVSAKTKRDVIREAASQYDFTQGKEAPVPEVAPASQAEHLRHVTETSNSPVELAEVFLNEEPATKNLSTKEQMIADYGMGKVKEESYRQFADKNSQNNAKSRAYFSSEGQSIDSLAKEMSDHYGVEISPEDVTNFIDSFPNGADAATATRESGIALAAKDRFSQLTGLPLTDEIAELAVKQKDIKEADRFAKDIPEDVAKIINDEGITSDNLEQVKHLFDGFPYTEEDLAAVREHLNSKPEGRSTETAPASEGSPEVKIDEPISNRERAEKIAQSILSLRSDGNNLYGGIAGVTTAIYDGMLSAAANVVRAGGTILDAIDAGVTYVQSKAPKADIERVKEFLHGAFKVPYTKPTATPSTLMVGTNIADTGIRLAELGKSMDKIEEGIKEKKLSWWDKFAKQTFEGQQEILKRLGEMGKKGAIVRDYLITTKGSTAKADAMFDQAKEAIYGGIDGLKKISIGGQTKRIKAVLNSVITLKRIIDIDKKMSDKFTKFQQLRADIETLKVANPADPKIVQLTRDYENIKEYLDYNDMLEYDGKNYKLKQYKHPFGYRADVAKIDLDNIEKEHPELFKQLNDRSELLSKSFHQIIDLKEESGILTKESADALREYFYAPRKDIEGFINSETDNASGGGGQPVKDRVGIKRLQGGNEELIRDDYDVQLHKAILNGMKDIALNNAGKKLLEAVRENNTNEFLYENTPQIYAVGPNKGKLIRDKFGNIKYDDIPTGKAKIKVWENGQSVELVGDQRIVDSWYDAHKSSQFASIFGSLTGAQVIRGAITGYNPGFGIFQLLVDPQSAVVGSGLYKTYTGGLATIYKDMIKVAPDVYHSKGVRGIAAEARDYGAFTSFSRGEDVLNLRSDIDVNKRRAVRAIKSTMEAFNWINDRSENLTRTALYSRSKNLQIEKYKKLNGNEPLGQDLEDIKVQAAHDARRYVDFARGGDFMKEANKVFPYLNAAVQLKRTVITAAVKDPIRFATMTSEAVAAGVGVMAYSLGLGWASHGLSDEEKKKRMEAYRNVNAETRSRYFLMYKGEDKDGKAQFWRIEKPMLINVAINAAEKGLLKHYYPDVEFNHKSFAKEMLDQSPVDRTIISRNPTSNAILQGWGNKNWYFNTEVVRNADNITDYLEGVDNKKTKDFYIMLGRKAKDIGIEGGISPLRTQAAVESYIGDPTQNPIVNMLTSTMALGLDAALGNTKALEERKKSFGELSNYLNFTTMPKRLIVQPSDITMEDLEHIKERNTRKADKKVLKKAYKLGRTF